MTDDAPIREMFRDLRGHESRLRRPPPSGEGAMFVAEGERLVLRTIEAGHVPVALLVNTRSSTGIPDLGCPVIHLDPPAIQSLTGFGAVRDLLCLFRRPPDPRLDDVLPGARRVLALEGVATPSNVGTIMRSAMALGVDAVLMGPGSGDPLGRRALRTSMGAALLRRWACTDDILATCRTYGLSALALTPAADAVSITHELATRRDERVALIVGSEGPGLTPATLAGAAARVTIPMAEGVDSLNVGAASAIACNLLMAHDEE